MVSYESLLDRGRREAMLRMKKQASALGADYVFNVKYETMAVGGGRLASIEVLAYGTALTAGQAVQGASPVSGSNIATNTATSTATESAPVDAAQSASASPVIKQ